jgi:hypothetical protein
MGRHANERMYREFERLDRLKQDEVEVLSEAQRAADMCEFWERIEKEVALVGVGEWHG